ncbi:MULTISPECIES: hypothetical protein [Nostocales]|uniref:Uncharacterized protein n=3 Tax=Nostocales TaxID=1161 RepID=A0A0C1R5S4_9CYAN|nr:hypothetical protein [Tolypothrix bouteillei]KAF3888166.1 hypothetical protein DA73_0400023735 [Tolypothrix bouteillei VB521301]
MQSEKFTLQWAIATFGGFLLSLLLIEIGEKSDINVLQGTVGGLIVALPQAFVLRTRLKNPWLWVWSSLAGWVFVTTAGIGAVGWMVLSTQVLVLRVFYGVLLGTIAGFSMGLAHWFVIQQYSPLAVQWVSISAVSWALGVGIGSAVGGILYQLTQLFLGEVVGLAVTWFVVAVFTGIYGAKIFRCWD